MREPATRTETYSTPPADLGISNPMPEDSQTTRPRHREESVSSGSGNGAAATFPRRFLAAVWAGWKKVAAKIAAVQTFILLLIIFIFVLGPIVLFMRLLRKDPMRFPRGAGTFWILRSSPRETLEDCTRQF